MRNLSHIAIIMDGNGRWALKKNKPRNFGHKSGLSNIKHIIQVCLKKKVKYLSLYVFSLNNWKRPKNEINYLFDLLDTYLNENIKYLIKGKIKVKFLGEKFKLPLNLINNLKKVEKLTSKNYRLTVNLLFNYSSRQEIVNSVNKFLKKNYFKRKLKINDICRNLYTSNIPDPEILIRTGNMFRLSDFLLWQISYTEIFFIKKLWPEFSAKDLVLIINKYFKIQRNFGGIRE